MTNAGFVYICRNCVGSTITPAHALGCDYCNQYPADHPCATCRGPGLASCQLTMELNTERELFLSARVNGRFIDTNFRPLPPNAPPTCLQVQRPSQDTTTCRRTRRPASIRRTSIRLNRPIQRELESRPIPSPASENERSIRGRPAVPAREER
jgi:hypothetical protein